MDGDLMATAMPPAYDTAWNRISLTDPSGGVSSYSYDSLNRLTGLANSNSGSFGFGYDTLGRRTSLTRPNSVDTSYTYDTLSRLLGVLHNGGSLPGSAAYTYDAAGNRTSKTAVQVGNPNPVSVLSQYSYDPIYELTQAVVGGTLAESYSYDPVGNRLTSAGPTSYNYNASNELTSTSAATYSYDLNGNTASKTDSTGTTNYTWDFENRLTQVALPGQGGTVNFKYDPFGRRVYKSSSAGTSIFVYDGDSAIQELSGTGSIVSQYAQGFGIDEPLAMYSGLTTSYFHTDGLGSITSLTDGSGQLASSYVYDSFGKLTASTGTITNPFHYTGREFDSETGLYYYRARYYDPNSGRFLSEDPIGLDGGINMYVYVGNDPVDWVDPSGKVKCVYVIQSTSNGHVGPVLACVSDDYSKTFMTRHVRSGYQACENNPSCAALRNMGPIPANNYILGGYGQTSRPHNPPRIPIYSPPGEAPYGRTGMQIHPGSTSTSSQGCIALDRPDYNRFVKFYKIDNKGTLTVMDWLEILP